MAKSWFGVIGILILGMFVLAGCGPRVSAQV
jgi:hypothetical protein